MKVPLINLASCLENCVKLQNMKTTTLISFCSAFCMGGALMFMNDRLSLLALETQVHHPCVDFSMHTPPHRSRLNPAWVCRGYPGVKMTELQKTPGRR